jgi:hypothetical protein
LAERRDESGAIEQLGRGPLELLPAQPNTLSIAGDGAGAQSIGIVSGKSSMLGHPAGITVHASNFIDAHCEPGNAASALGPRAHVRTPLASARLKVHRRWRHHRYTWGMSPVPRTARFVGASTRQCAQHREAIMFVSGNFTNDLDGHIRIGLQTKVAFAPKTN